MNSHKNARFTALGRAELVRRVVDLGQTASQVAASFGVCVKTVRKWVAQFEAEESAFQAAELQRHAAQFSRERFEGDFSRALDRAWEWFAKGRP